jgi:hypothetical protein
MILRILQEAVLINLNVRPRGTLIFSIAPKRE